jgi:hypothetical protein
MLLLIDHSQLLPTNLTFILTRGVAPKGPIVRAAYPTKLLMVH